MSRRSVRLAPSVLTLSIALLLIACARPSTPYDPYSFESARPQALERPKSVEAKAKPNASHAASQAGPGMASSSIDDTQLSRAIEAAFRRDPVLASERLSVAADDGAVAVSGEVPMLAAKNRALQIVASFRGPTSIVDRIAVTPASQPDAQVARDVASALQRDPTTRQAHVVVTDVAGAVKLAGAVDSPVQRQLAAAVASSVPGVHQIDDELHVVANPPRSDEEITADVRERIADDARLDAARLAVATEGHVATLSGVVPSLAAERDAFDDAWVAGVSSVDTRGVRVDWRASRQARPADQEAPIDDGRIVAVIRRELDEDPRVAGAPPDVVSNDGFVTLAGTVASPESEHAAIRDAYGVRGVWAVRDDLQVGRSDEDAQVTTTSGVVPARGGRTQHWIARDASGVPGAIGYEERLDVAPSAPRVRTSADVIRDRAFENLFWDPRVSQGSVVVQVAPDGHVRLTGVVRSAGERRAAEQDAMQAGAKSLDNRLQVKP